MPADVERNVASLCVGAFCHHLSMCLPFWTTEEEVFTCFAFEFANSYGWTPLHAASVKGHTEVIKLLLANGADVTVASSNRWTPLNAAAHGGHVDVVKLLLASGGDVTIANNNGWTPLHAASVKGHIDIVKLLSEKGSLADVMDDKGRSPFSYACTRGHLEVVEHLWSRNVAATTTDRYGATPLFAATGNGHEKVVAYLLAMGCDYGSFVDGLGRTLLWWAAKSGNAKVIEAVVQLTKSEGTLSLRRGLGRGAQSDADR